MAISSLIACFISRFEEVCCLLNTFAADMTVKTITGSITSDSFGFA